MSPLVAEAGKAYRLGSHRLVCGDSSDPEVVGRLAAGDRIQTVLTDPPYGCAVVESKEGFTGSRSAHARIRNDQLQTGAEYAAFTRSWVAAAKPFLAAKNSFYVFNSDKMVFSLKEALDAEGLHFGQLLIWVKSQPVIGRLDYLPQHELIAYGWHGTHAFRKSKDKSVLFCPKPGRSALHPTMKPVSLLRRLILNSTPSGGWVYDGFGGSGSTLLAAEQTGRRCLMAEVEPKYVGVIISRWESLTGLRAEEMP